MRKKQKQQTIQHKLKFINGIALYSSKGITTKPHRHFALEIIVSLNEPFEILTPEKKYNNCKVAIVPKNIKHQFINNKDNDQVFIFIDPFHQFSILFEKKIQLSEIIIVDLSTLDKNYFTTLLDCSEINEKELLETISNILLGQDTDNMPTKNKTDTRIIQSFEYIENNLYTGISINSVSKSIFLSESRYAHLFKLEVGIPFRRYILWQRIQKTIQSVLKGNSLTLASYDGGFSDISHFNKVFHEMFGISPSSALKE